MAHPIRRVGRLTGSGVDGFGAFWCLVFSGWSLSSLLRARVSPRSVAPRGYTLCGSAAGSGLLFYAVDGDGAEFYDFPVGGVFGGAVRVAEGGEVGVHAGGGVDVEAGGGVVLAAAEVLDGFAHDVCGGVRVNSADVLGAGAAEDDCGFSGAGVQLGGDDDLEVGVGGVHDGLDCGCGGDGVSVEVALGGGGGVLLLEDVEHVLLPTCGAGTVSLPLSQVYAHCEGGCKLEAESV